MQSSHHTCCIVIGVLMWWFKKKFWMVLTSKTKTVQNSSEQNMSMDFDAGKQGRDSSLEEVLLWIMDSVRATLYKYTLKNVIFSE